MTDLNTRSDSNLDIEILQLKIKYYMTKANAKCSFLFQVRTHRVYMIYHTPFS